jgi:hypothetical protein
VKALNARGHFVWKNHGSAYSKRGLSDISGVCRDGRGIALETKISGKERSGLSPDQKRFLRDFVTRAPNAICGVVSSVEAAIAAVEEPLRYAKIFPDGYVAMIADFDPMASIAPWRKNP